MRRALFFSAGGVGDEIQMITRRLTTSIKTPIIPAQETINTSTALQADDNSNMRECVTPKGMSNVRGIKDIHVCVGQVMRMPGQKKSH
jgi:hypothetical protein